VPLPEEHGPVTDALMAAMMLRRGTTKQLALDFRLGDSSKAVDQRWRDVQENERKSRARFAQNAMKPQEVGPEWTKARELLGGPEAAFAFVKAAMDRFGAPLEEKRARYLAHVHGLNHHLRERLEERNLSGSISLATSDPVPSGTTLVTRTHPLTSTLAEALVEGALDPLALPGLGLGRTGVWPTPAVKKVTTIAFLRLRLKLTVHARKERLLLAEEAALLAICDGKIVATGAGARALLAAGASHDLAASARDRILGKAHDGLQVLINGAFSQYANARAEELRADHARLRTAAGGASRVTVEPVLPPDVIGLFVLLPTGV